MAEGAGGRGGLVRPRTADGVHSRHEPSSQQEQREDRTCSAVAVRGKSMPRCCFDVNIRTPTTTTTTTATRTLPRARLSLLRRAGTDPLRSGYALLLSTAALLSLPLFPATCLGSGLLAAAVTAPPSPSPLHDNLWDAISGDPEYSKLTACLEMADPSVADLLRAASGSAAGQPLTLFAPKDEAFEQPAWRGSKGGKNTTIFDDR